MDIGQDVSSQFFDRDLGRPFCKTHIGDNLVAHKGAVQMMATGGVVLPIGTLDLVDAQSETGSVKWSITYIPYDDGAEMSLALGTEA